MQKVIAVLAFLAITLSPTSASADPWQPPSDPSQPTENKVLNPIGGPGWKPLTSEQQAKVDAKNAHKEQSKAYFASQNKGTAGPVPDCAGCHPPYPSSASVGTYGHQQAAYNYCAPAATQTVERYTKGTETSQTTIASYEGTSSAGTYVYMARAGLNNFAVLPANFVYDYYQPSDGIDWYATVQEDIGYYGMPQVPTVAPHDNGASYWLPSWPNPITTGHYIVTNGYAYNDYASGLVSYNDSSAGYGGGTGTWGSVSTGTMWYTITLGNPSHDPSWVIW